MKNMKEKNFLSIIIFIYLFIYFTLTFTSFPSLGGIFFSFRRAVVTNSIISILGGGRNGTEDRHRRDIGETFLSELHFKQFHKGSTIPYIY